jgi:GT2 family glycosyltransferase
VSNERARQLPSAAARSASSVPVMILNWNGWEDTFACLRSIRDTGEEHEVWLVDNGSIDDRSTEARATYPGLRLLKLEDNYGWAGGYNRALSVAEGEGYEFAYLLNNDCTVESGFLSTSLQVGLAHSDLAAVGSMVSYVEPPGFIMFDGRYYDPGDKIAGPVPPITWGPTVNGAAMLIRLQALRNAGYFNEQYFCYREEEDWCFRAASRGWRTAVAGESLVLHRDHGSDRNEDGRYYKLRNWFLLQKTAIPRQSRWTRTYMVYTALRGANHDRRSGNIEQAGAIVAALWDVHRGSYGKRGGSPPIIVTWALTHFWIFPSGIFRTRAHRVLQWIGLTGLAGGRPRSGV